VTIASSAGLVPLRSAVSYTTSKHAAVGFHDSVRQELRTQAPGVLMTLVTPFFVNTGMFTGTKSRLAVWPDNRQEPQPHRRKLLCVYLGGRPVPGCLSMVIDGRAGGQSSVTLSDR
jgi:NAD(P)-dependent dehydrogenase (short-subunit alcohol dehydrogenase family)